MTDENLQIGSAPENRPRWLVPLLVVSLAANLLIGAAVATRHFYMGGLHGPDRMAGASYTQLIPRRFFAEVPRDRKRVFLDILKNYRDEFRNEREASNQVAAKLSDVIDSPTYDPEKARQVVNEFANQNAKLAQRGGAAVLDILAVLTPEERQLLAKVVRERPMRKK